MTIVPVWIFLTLFAARLSDRSDTSVCRQPCSFPWETTQLICYCPVQTSFLVILTTKDSLIDTVNHWGHKHNLAVSPLLHQVLACRTFTAIRKKCPSNTVNTWQVWKKLTHQHSLGNDTIAQDSSKRQADMNCVDVKLKFDEKIMSIFHNKPSKHFLCWCTWSAKYFFLFFQQIRILCFIISSQITRVFILQQIQVNANPCEVGYITY